MPIPNNTSFTLVNVCDELGLIGGSRTLNNCFSSANPIQFDPAYAGSKTSLLNFRNYGAVTMTAFIMSTTGTTELLSCGEARQTTRYHNGANPNPTSGDIVYTDLEETIVLNGGGQWFKIDDFEAYQISSNGVLGIGILCEF